MRNRLSGRYTFSGVARFAWPTISMLIFTSLYIMVDGAFVASLIGTDALSAVNIVMPFFILAHGFGIMLATGASAIVATKMGRGENRQAKQNFSFIALVTVLSGLILGSFGWYFVDDVVRILGAGPEVFEYSRQYAGLLFAFIPLALMQIFFQTFFVAAGRPGLGLASVVAGGLTNVLLDYVFIAVLDMGIGGAALATGVGYSIPALTGLLYFALARKSSLYFTRPTLDWRVLLYSCGNGASEMVTNISVSIVTYMFNLLMMRYLGVDGVAAITIVLYAEFLFSSIYFGFSSGVAPLFSYIYGKSDAGQLKKLFRNCLIFICICSGVAIAVSTLMAGNIVAVFAQPTSLVYSYAVVGFRLHALCFLFMGFNIFASALFTALSNGKVSALLSFLRTFVFLVLSLLLLPEWLGVYGIWLAVPAAEAASIMVSALYMVRMRYRYRYA